MSTLKTEEYLLPFDPEFIASGLCYKKYVDLNIQNYNFPHSFVWVWSLVAHITERILAEGVGKYDVAVCIGSKTN
jgi:hypothetical protein